jgi:hypothetical protein
MSEDSALMTGADTWSRLSGHSTRPARAEAGAIEAQLFILRMRRRLVIDCMAGEATQGEICAGDSSERNVRGSVTRGTVRAKPARAPHFPGLPNVKQIDRKENWEIPYPAD